jgi:hypothetical protein
VRWSGFKPSDGIALTSAGGGLRLFLDGDLQADLGIAVPLGRREPGQLVTPSAGFVYAIECAQILSRARGYTLFLACDSGTRRH